MISTQNNSRIVESFQPPIPASGSRPDLAQMVLKERKVTLGAIREIIESHFRLALMEVLPQNPSLSQKHRGKEVTDENEIVAGILKDLGEEITAAVANIARESGGHDYQISAACIVRDVLMPEAMKKLCLPS